MSKRIKYKGLKITLLVLIFLGAATASTLRYLYKNDENVKYYFDLPKEVKRESVKLSLSMVRNFIIPYDIDEEAIKEVSKKDIEKSIALGAYWIVAMQEEQGRFNYWYSPDDNLLSSRGDDNFLRQAGTCYSLCVAAQAIGDTNLLIAAQKNMDYLLNFLRNLDDDKSYFIFRRKAKLGGIALPMLAMLKMKELSKTNRYDEDLKRLVNMILYLQDQYSTGQFKSTYIYLDKYDYDWHSEIYPGEALYALSEMYKTFGDEVYKERFDYAAKFYDKREFWTKSAFMPWTISALSNMYLLTKEEYYLDYAKKITDRMLVTQNMNPKSMEYGSWNPLPMVNSSTCMEALGDLSLALELAGDEEELNYYTSHSIIGYRWLMGLQFTQDEMDGIEQPNYALGGFPASKTERKIRIDNTQHSITALSKGLMNVYKQEPKL